MLKKDLIKKFHPSEISFFLNPKSISLQLFITQTITYLISEKVLKIEVNEGFENQFSTKKLIISIGDFFDDYRFIDLEIPFLVMFKVNKDLKIELFDFINDYLNKKEEKWKLDLLNSKNLHNYFINQLELNKVGKELQFQLENYINTLNVKTETEYLHLVNLNHSNASSDYHKDEPSMKKSVYIKDSSFIQSELVTLIYEMSIKAISDRKKYNTGLKWKNYNTGGVGG
ncbi:hypothetical protein [Aquimarina sediminis]|uniref:hypothetical protein n=1 Tax=Aquimarina sediminis TaxID=2070536 RepID=UPI000CA023B9|nr:hypothetical protein [Aquimarina sediminis]